MPADPRRIVISLLAIALALAVPLVVAAQSDGLKEASTSTFTLLPDEDLIHADITITLVNQQKTPLRRWDSIWTPATAENVKITGKGVTTDTVSDGRGIRDTVNFPPLTRKGKKKIRVGYDLVDDAFAGANPTLVQDDYARFCWGGEATDTGIVKAILPPGWQAATAMESVEVTTTPEGTTLRAPGKQLPGEFYACTDAFATNLGSRVYVLGPSEQVITLDSWTDDPDWEPAMLDITGVQLRILERLIGTAMPVEALTVQEVARTNPFGSATDFHPADDLLLVDQDVDIAGAATVALARTWFNETTIADPWLSEGLALWAGLSAHDQTCPAPPSQADAEAPDLAAWKVREDNPSAWDEDRYLFQAATACSIIEKVATMIGPEAMTEVTTSLLTNPTRADWMTWLDAIGTAAPPEDTASNPDGSDELAAFEIAELLLEDYGIATLTEITGRAAGRN